MLSLDEDELKLAINQRRLLAGEIYCGHTRKRGIKQSIRFRLTTNPNEVDKCYSNVVMSA